MGLIHPNERIRLLEEFVQGHSPLAQSGDEPTQGIQIVDESLHAFHIADGAHPGDGRDLFGVGFDTALAE
jgi:hypothetical protein